MAKPTNKGRTKLPGKAPAGTFAHKTKPPAGSTLKQAEGARKMRISRRQQAIDAALGKK